MFTNKPAAFIFDLDGTLLDTEPLYTQAAQKILDRYDAVFDPELKRRTMGGDSRVSAKMVIDHFNLPLTVDNYLSERESYLIQLFKAAPEINGAGAFIEAVSRSGVKIGLATSSHLHLSDLKLGNKTWNTHFDVRVCGDHPDLERAKPEPDIFILCATLLGVSPDQCIAFEDSPNGVKAAKAASMKVVAINSPYVKPGDLKEADIVISDFTEILPELSRWLS